MNTYESNRQRVSENIRSIYAVDTVQKAQKEKEVNLEGIAEDDETDEEVEKDDKIKKTSHKEVKKAWALEQLDLLEKSKYFKREGTKGNYKYYYTEAEYNKAKGNGGSINIGLTYKLPTTEAGESVNFNIKSFDGKVYTIETVNKEGRRNTHNFDEKTLRKLISESKILKA